MMETVQPVTEQQVKTRLPALGGSYILILKVTEACEITVGRKGRLNLRPGYYCYVGSAFGPGGLRARVGRHARLDKAYRWHIDFLRAVSQLVGVFYSTDVTRLEDAWAESMQTWPGMEIPMPGFGASDSKPLSHLFYSQHRPNKDHFHALAGQGGAFLPS
jgi:Uri superfamily endonuclease